ncbi:MULTISPECIES: DUF6586 family protein [Cobetia]|uniref:Uncharacterized protein n=1 Tax=Cobetia crustatorum TaxID=553385 RepID=A0A558HXD5_9GAMM|nr:MULTISPECIES: DUF6586 family protein [Cobetia]TVU73792.1 hypothetical protein FQP86_01610 [Cobetia crustatorum]
MSHRARTNQLLYQAELLLAQSAVTAGDEHDMARRMANEEGALVLLELALSSLLDEFAVVARWPQDGWRERLTAPPTPVAEIEQLRILLERPDSWLSQLVSDIDRLHAETGAARREEGRVRGDGLIIAAAANASLVERLTEVLAAFKAILPGLRESSVEW